MTGPYDLVTYDFWPVVKRGKSNITIGNENGSGNAIQKLFYGKEQNDAPYTFTDKSGNSSSVSQTIIIKDITAPIVPSLHKTTAKYSTSVAAPIISDICDVVITGTTTNSTNLSGQGTHTINWTFTPKKVKSSLILYPNRIDAKNMNRINVIFHIYYFFRRFADFKDGVFPVVSLLSCARLSDLIVDFAILFSPGFSTIILVCVYFFSIL